MGTDTWLFENLEVMAVIEWEHNMIGTLFGVVSSRRKHFGVLLHSNLNARLINLLSTWQSQWPKCSFLWLNIKQDCLCSVHSTEESGCLSRTEEKSGESTREWAYLFPFEEKIIIKHILVILDWHLFSLLLVQTEDYLKRKIRSRPERSELVRMHILEGECHVILF